MKKVFLTCVLVIFITPFVFSQETFTLTTYYPAPFGVYAELRTKRIAIGDDYVNNSGSYCWSPQNCANQFNANTKLAVEGNVGIGTTNPLRELYIRAIDPSGNANILLEGVKTADNTATAVWNIRSMGDSVTGDMQGAFILTDWDGPSLFTAISSPVIIEKGAADNSLRIDNLGNVGIGVAHPQTPAPNGQQANIDVNDIWLRSKGTWASTLDTPIICSKFNYEINNANTNNVGNVYRFVASDCTGGKLPDASYVGFLAKTEVCGHDESWSALNADEGGPGVTFATWDPLDCRPEGSPASKVSRIQVVYIKK